MEIIVRSSVIFLFLFLVTRGLGRKELSQLSAFDLILFVIMGDIVQQGVTQEDMSLTGNMLAVSTIVVWILLFSVLNYRVPRLRPVLEGVPLIIVRNGEMIDQVLERERLSRDEVLQEARLQGIDDLRSVKVGVLEADGKFAFIRADGGEPQGAVDGPITEAGQ
ncbi:MAG TPA: YetF domain-containing protein [Acidimicrobiales bacterium]|nr:YetF domain-containing protein [Acidimicrobiales bacterium]